MAIKYSEIKKKLKEDPLSAEELRIIDKIEKYIDEKIIRDFDNNSVSIEFSIVRFDYLPGEDRQIHIKETRKKLMRSELARRYHAAGWEDKVDLYEGPSQGCDYWVLTGKK